MREAALKFLKDSRTEKTIRFFIVGLGLCFWSFWDADKPSLQAPTVLYFFLFISLQPGIIGFGHLVGTLIALALATGFGVSSYLLLALIDHGKGAFFGSIIASLVGFLPLFMSGNSLVLLWACLVFVIVEKSLFTNLPSIVQLHQLGISGEQTLHTLWLDSDLTMAVLRNGLYSALIVSALLASTYWPPPLHLASDLFASLVERFLRGLAALLRSRTEAPSPEITKAAPSLDQLGLLLAKLNSLSSLAVFELGLWPLGGAMQPPTETSRLVKLLASLFIEIRLVTSVPPPRSPILDELREAVAGVLELFAMQVPYISGLVVCQDASLEVEHALDLDHEPFLRHRNAVEAVQEALSNPRNVNAQMMMMMPAQHVDVDEESELPVPPDDAQGLSVIGTFSHALLACDQRIIEQLRLTIITLARLRHRPSAKGFLVTWLFPLLFWPVKLLVEWLNPFLRPFYHLQRVWETGWLFFAVRMLCGIGFFFALMTFSTGFANFIAPDAVNATGSWVVIGILFTTQLSTEGCIKKGILRFLGTVVGSWLAYGLSVAASHSDTRILIPLTLLFIVPLIWALPPALPSAYTVPIDGVYGFMCAGFTFVIVITETAYVASDDLRLQIAQARFVSQVIAIGLVIVFAILLPVSQYSLARRAVARLVDLLPSTLEGIAAEGERACAIAAHGHATEAEVRRGFWKNPLKPVQKLYDTHRNQGQENAEPAPEIFEAMPKPVLQSKLVRRVSSCIESLRSNAQQVEGVNDMIKWMAFLPLFSDAPLEQLIKPADAFGHMLMLMTLAWSRHDFFAILLNQTDPEPARRFLEERFLPCLNRYCACIRPLFNQLADQLVADAPVNRLRHRLLRRGHRQIDGANANYLLARQAEAWQQLIATKQQWIEILQTCPEWRDDATRFTLHSSIEALYYSLDRLSNDMRTLLITETSHPSPNT